MYKKNGKGKSLKRIQTAFNKFATQHSQTLRDLETYNPELKQTSFAKVEVNNFTYCLVRIPNADQLILTKKQSEIALLVAQGLSNSDIAKTMGIKSSTVAAHISRIFSKFDIRSRSELTRRSILLS